MAPSPRREDLEGLPRRTHGREMFDDYLSKMEGPIFHPQRGLSNQLQRHHLCCIHPSRKFPPLWPTADLREQNVRLHHFISYMFPKLPEESQREMP